MLIEGCTVYFWPHTERMHVASYRLRCHLVMAGLRSSGIEALLYRLGSKPQTLVLSKRYDFESIETALSLKARFGTKLYLDLCDNHFYFQDTSQKAVRRANELEHAVRSVDHVIVSTDYLAEAIRARLRRDVHISVLADLVEFPKILQGGFKYEAQHGLTRHETPRAGS